MSKITEAARRLSVARTELVLDHPFFGALALRMSIVESDRTETMATDGRSLYYCAAFVDKQTHAQLVGTLAHEVMHPAMQHHTRRGERDAKLWNYAADYAINPLIVDAGLTLPEGALLDRRYRGRSAEQIYDQLEQQQQQNQPGPSQQGPDLANLPGAVIDAPDLQQDAAEWRIAVKQAAKSAEMMGRMPSNIVREVEESTKPPVDWRALLRRFVQQTATSDYSWRRPNPRYIAGGIYMPELRSESMPPIVVGVDTSGSIYEQTLSAFRIEIQSIADEVHPEAIHVIYVDAEVQSVETFARGEPIVMHAEGGGGTDFRPLFDHVERESLDPVCAIYLTDGYGEFPDSPPDYPVLWAMTTSVEAPWGETVEVQS